MASGWVARLLGRAMAWYVRLVAATCRVHGPPVAADQVVIACWHEYNLAAAIAAWRLRPEPRHVSFSTRTFRGQVMNEMLARLDTASVPLPDEGSRAESAALARTMARIGREGASLVVSPDGPFGPYRRAKPGALIVARAAGLPIVPWAVAVRPPVRLRGRWDRHVVPLPFCRLWVEEGERIVVGARQPLRPLLARLQAELDAATARADRRMGSPSLPAPGTMEDPP
ncbi:MAG TPA: hypothetical protein VHQ42_02525 [Candidatus Limnocylindria bacterium]|nr:hypothetical protein [Candidatus Limnocylindria bacterium]